MKKQLLIFLFTGVATIVSAQNVGIGTADFTPSSSALLELRSTNSGFLMPRMTSVQMTSIAEPTEGLLVYQTNSSKGFKFFNGSDWMTLTDNFGNHTAEANIKLNGNWLSNDGTNKGIRVASSGKVGLGTDTPNAQLEVDGDVRVTDLAGSGTRMVVADANGDLSTQALPTSGSMPTTVESSSNQNVNSASYSSVSGMSISSVPAGTYLVNFNSDISRNGSSSCQCIVRAGGSNDSDTERTFQFPAGGDSQFHLMGKVTLSSAGTIEIHCKKIPEGSGISIGKRSMSIQPTN